MKDHELENDFPMESYPKGTMDATVRSMSRLISVNIILKLALSDIEDHPDIPRDVREYIQMTFESLAETEYDDTEEMQH